MARRSRTRLDPSVRREQIVVAAARVFEDRDPAEVTFEQVAEEAGVFRGLVYNYFGDKGGLIAAVYRHQMARLDAQLRETYLRPGSGRQRLGAIVDCYLSFAECNAGSWSLIGTAEWTLHPSVREAREDRYARMTARFGSDLEIRLLTRGMLGFLDSATATWLEHDPLPDRARVATTILDALWGAIVGLGGEDLLELDAASAAVP